MEGEILLALGHPEQALQAADQALRVKPSHFAAHLVRARAYAALARPEAALGALNEALRIYPGYQEARALQGALAARS
jgi:tetratricopeptide (TPR) repeat protein